MAQLHVEAEGVGPGGPGGRVEARCQCRQLQSVGTVERERLLRISALTAPDGAGVIRWMRYGRTTTVEKVLASEPARRLVYTVVKGIPVRNYVRAENRIHGSDQQSCSPGAPPVMITRSCACGSCSS